MKNKEKYQKELYDFLVHGEGFGVLKHTKKPMPCRNSCCLCKFDDDCVECRKEWLEQEYVEPKVFTKEEKILIDLLENVDWVARNLDGSLWGYENKPYWDDIVEEWRTKGISYDLGCTTLTFNAIKCVDKEPTSREEILGE